MRYRILGPLAVEVAGAPLRIRSGRVSALLATLLLEVNRTVPADRLIEAMWDWQAPPTARAQLTIVVSQLRRLLAQAGAPSAAVVTETAGYRLHASTGEIDSLLFEQRVNQAERTAASGRPAEAAEGLRSALELWRGPALAGMDGRVVRAAATMLAERRTAVQARRIELDLALGRHDALITELVGLVTAAPFNERLRSDLIIALYRSGRVTEALNAFGEFRHRLADEFGIEPGGQLTVLHRRILNRDPLLDPPVGTAAATLSAPTGAASNAHPADDTGVASADPADDTGSAGRAHQTGGTGSGTDDRLGPDRPGPRPGGPPGHRRTAGRPGRRGLPWRRPGGQPRGPAHRRPGGRDGTVRPPSAGWPSIPDESARTAPPEDRPTPSTPSAHARPTPGTPPVHARPTPGTPPTHARPTPGTPPTHARPTPGVPPVHARLPVDRAAAHDVPVTPRQLPPAVADFVGREPELTRIRRVVDVRTDRPGPAVVVVSGLPGVGKTALAIRAGWLLGGDHPDGCLYAELAAPAAPATPAGLATLGSATPATWATSATTADGRGVPVDPHEVLGAFLRALGVADGSIPANRAERAAHYRSVVAERRLLVVLDGADDEEQVRSLLPTGPASAALITARRPLTGLDGAHLIALDALPVEPAVRLLTGMLPERMVDDVSAARRVVQLCDGLPLAIRTAGSRLVVRTERSLAETAQRLADGTRRLDRLASGDRDVRRGLASTYQRLDPHAATLFRRLGSLPVADFPGWLAVALLDTDRTTADLALAELLDAGLVRPDPAHSAGTIRYRMPELIRLYAQERVGLDDPPPLRATAHRRAYWWLLELTLRADARVPCQVFPTGDLGLPEGFGPPVDVLRTVDDDPVGWLTAERDLVVAVVQHAAALGDTELAWRLAVAPTNFFQLRGDTDGWQRALEHAGTTSAGRSGPSRADAVLSLSHALLLLSRSEPTAAWTAARTGRRLFQDLGDPQRVAACGTVQSMAGHRMTLLDPAVIEQSPRRNTDDPGSAGATRGTAQHAGVTRRAAPAQCQAE